MPLEKNMVRYLDNFSGGRRGAAAAEAFIALGCAVIFTYRTFTLEPYSRLLSTGNALLRTLEDGNVAWGDFDACSF